MERDRGSPSTLQDTRPSADEWTGPKPWDGLGIITDHFVADLTLELTFNDEWKFVKQRRGIGGRKKAVSKAKRHPGNFR